MKGSTYGVSGTAKSMEDRTFSSAASATLVRTTINAKKVKVFSSYEEIGVYKYSF
jgi:hypothetical protein